MSNKNSKSELKIKEKFLINIESRSDEKKIKFSKWLSAQNNPQNSFLSLVEHSIDRFGYEDITDHEIAKKLHTEIIYFNNKSIEQLKEEWNVKSLDATSNKVITFEFKMKTNSNVSIIVYSDTEKEAWRIFAGTVASFKK